MLVAVVHAALSILVRRLGFDHVSDDDFARVTIAQSFAHAPKLDPSGTSWLPFPFWLLGSVMLVAGRSLEMARAVSIAFASAAAAVPYVALREIGVPRGRALGALAFVFASPWTIWLGAATVPESMTASFAAGAVIALGARDDAARRSGYWFAAALFAACMSRYEAWPMAAVVALALGVRAIPRDGLGPRRVAFASIVVVGPLLWMAWNWRAHGSPIHFFHRVSNFKRAIGEGAVDPLAALLVFPRLVVQSRPAVFVATAAALVFVLFRREIRARWAVPLVAVAAQIGFLAYGSLRDGTPAHHPERALLGSVFVLAMFAADALASMASATLASSRASAFAIVSVALLIGTVCVSNGVGVAASPPGARPDEDRSWQLREGEAARRAGVERLYVTPCAFEHFALIAAYGAPERVETFPAHPRTHEAEACPRVDTAAPAPP